VRYFTNGSGGRFSHHCLLSHSDIRNIIHSARAEDMYCSVQSYNRSGDELWSQLVFDIDSKDMAYAYRVASEIADNVADEYDADTSIWFSGSKGFHVITGLVGYGEYANTAMKSIAHKFSSEVDDSMYKTRSMFRLPNSKNAKSKLRKIQVNHNESLPSIMSRARTVQPFVQTELDFNNKKFLTDHKASVFEIMNRPEVDTTIVDVDWKHALVPCLKALLCDGVSAGNRWAFCFMLVKHWRLCGVDLDGAIALSKMYPVFKEAGGGAGYTAGMIKHYYCNDTLIPIGCKTSELSSLMQENCVNTCVYTKEGAEYIVRYFLEGMNEHSRYGT